MSICIAIRKSIVDDSHTVTNLAREQETVPDVLAYHGSLKGVARPSPNTAYAVPMSLVYLYQQKWGDVLDLLLTPVLVEPNTPLSWTC